MPEIFVNQTRKALDPPPQTWGDLLGILDRDATKDGVLLTGARIDGVDVPSFRDPGMTVQRLAAVGRVDVETATPVAFLRQCLADSIASLDETARAAVELSAVYRGVNVAAGHQGLAALALELGGLPTLVATLQGPLQLDLRNVAVYGMTPPEHVEALGGVLDSLVAGQESEDWLTVADVLEYDLEPAVRGWQMLLQQLAAQIAA